MSFMDKIKNKKGIVIAAIVLIAVAIGGGATLAYFSSTTNEVHNEFKGAAVNIAVLENKEDTGNDKLLEDATASNKGIKTFSSNIKDPVSKIVQIKNKDTEQYHTVDTYVRVRLVPKLVYDDDNKEGYAGQTSVDLNPDNVVYIFANDNGGKWVSQTLNANGKQQTYYYYTEAIKPGEVSNVLLASVQYKDGAPQGQHFELEVLTEGIAAGQHSKEETVTDPDTGEQTVKEVRADYKTAWENVLNSPVSVTDLQ